MVPSIHFLMRQAAREKLAAVRTLNEEAKGRHYAMAELYITRAQQLQAASDAEDTRQPLVVRKKTSRSRGRVG